MRRSVQQLCRSVLPQRTGRKRCWSVPVFRATIPDNSDGASCAPILGSKCGPRTGPWKSHFFLWQAASPAWHCWEGSSLEVVGFNLKWGLYWGTVGGDNQVLTATVKSKSPDHGIEPFLGTEYGP